MKKLTAILILAAMFMTGCKDSPKQDNKEKADAKKEVKKDEVVLLPGDSTLVAMKNGKGVTQDLWSTDSATFVMKFKDGKPTGSIIYHKNGKEAVVADTKTGTSTYYDESGKEIPDTVFFDKYADFLEEITPQLESVFAKMAKDAD